jgi:hypothetical protein
MNLDFWLLMAADDAHGAVRAKKTTKAEKMQSCGIATTSCIAVWLWQCTSTSNRAQRGKTIRNGERAAVDAITRQQGKHESMDENDFTHTKGTQRPTRARTRQRVSQPVC